MRVLLAYDGFERSAHALEETVKLVAPGDKVTVLSVVAPGEGSMAGHGLTPHAHQDVTRAHAYLEERGIESETKVSYGEPAEEIVAEAKAGAYDQIVVGSRGLGPLGRLVVGSVSSKVVENAPCPVLVAGKDTTERIEPAKVVA